MKDLDTLGVLGTQKTVFFQEPPVEYVQKIHILEKQLAIATKALEEIDVRSQRDWNEYDCMGCAKKALYDIEMEGVK